MKPAPKAPQAPGFADAIFRPANDPARLQPAFFQRGPGSRRGDNIRAFQDPMTLEQVFPGLHSSPGGAIIGLADNVFDLTGPGGRINGEINSDRATVLLKQIEMIDPGYRFESLGSPKTLAGQINQIEQLRFDRAAAFLRVKGELEPMKVETLRFMQASADRAYLDGKIRLKNGTLSIHISEELTLGNYIGREVRRDMRRQYGRSGIDSAGKGPIRVNRREKVSDDEATYRRPDARVGNVAFDVTLEPKTLRKPQIRGFFKADFAPVQVVIIRPSQLGTNHSYIISRPEAGK